jgi:hypothetical protein
MIGLVNICTLLRKSLVSYVSFATDPDIAGLHNDECAAELFALLLHDLPDSLGQCLADCAREADQDDAGGVSMANENQSAEVFVLCQQDAVFATGLINQFTIVRTLCDFAYGEHIVAIGSQGAHDGEVTAFIG